MITQNSVAEGFGLTVLEAQYKRQVVVGSRQAVGIREQITDLETGVFVEGDPCVGANVAAALWTALTRDDLRQRLSQNAQRYAVETGLSYTQVKRWIEGLCALSMARDGEEGGQAADSTGAGMGAPPPPLPKGASEPESTGVPAMAPPL